MWKHAHKGVAFLNLSFIDQLTKIELSPKEAGAFIPFSAMKKPFAGKDADKITNATLFARLGECLDESCAVIADPGDALFGGIDLPIKSSINFISSAFYASLGFAVPAAIGASFADPSLRPIVLVGDGADDKTCPLFPVHQCIICKGI